MTSKLTRERLEALANAEYCKSNPGAWLLGLKEVNELARMALAAMDSEAKEPISFDEWSRKCALQVTLCYSDFREKAQYIWDSARETMHVEPSVPVLTRADFENWCKKRLALSPSYFEKDASGVYTRTLVHDMYIAWEACRAAMLSGGKS
ncbi:hypothetical protein D9K90_21500 [Klebsiella pneumoniae]|uniref:hypothetical protein n=1 Tax=Klebsiella pneumoniae TaxID=573 RepID=UPI000EF21105|nr:hypothetical protein [Klebsiella pneumoniae]RLL51560.1 hypothetical protein D9K90_21500 [Klebsiella pneumoniae]